MVYIVAIAIVLALVAMKALAWQAVMRHEIKYAGSPYRGGGYIYFFRARREPFWRVKIGRAKHPLDRLADHITANPFGVEVLAVIHVASDVRAETNIHRRFADRRIQREWFNLSLGLWLYILLVQDRVLTKEIRECLTSGRRSKICGQVERKSRTSRGTIGKRLRNV